MSWLSPRAIRRRPQPRRNLFRPAVVPLESRVNPTNVLTYHMDAASDGVNNSETVLTRTNVNSTSFGKNWQVQVQGQIYAEPLILQGVNITVGPNAGMHDVVFVATEHDQLYAYDAAAAAPTLLWQRNFLDISNANNHLSGATALTTVPQADVNTSDITVEIGITGTPVIDANTGTIYLVTKTKETVGSTAHYVQRLHAVNIQTGADQTAPYVLGDTTFVSSVYTNNTQIYSYGSGDGHVTDPYNGTGQQVVQFNALREHQRPALNLINGVVYMGWASHGDNGPYHGWMVAVSAYSTGTPTMTLKGVLDTTPNGGLGGIWMAGGALTFDGTYFYFETGNGTFDGNNGTGTGSNTQDPPGAPGPVTGLDSNGFPVNADFGDSFCKVAIDPTSTPTSQNKNGWGLKIVDYFTPLNQAYLNSTDQDVGSSACVVVPDYIGGTNPPPNQFASAAHPKLLVGSGKEGVIYLLDRTTSQTFNGAGYNGSMGGYSNPHGSVAHGNAIVQNSNNELSGSLDSAALFNGRMYYVEGYGGYAKTFAFANAAFSNPYETRSTDGFAFAGSTPFITANNGSNGIVWDVDRGTNQLRAYSTDTYATELWNSGQAINGRDTLGAAVKFQVATVANGRVYVAAGTGDPNNVLVVYGLIAPPTGAPNVPANLTAQPPSGTQITLSWTDTSVAPNTADSFYVEESTNGTTFTQVGIATTTSFAVTGLATNTTYYFRVRAHNAQGLSGYSNVSSATTTAGTHSIDYTGGFTTANTTPGSTHGGLQFNGATQANMIVSNTLELTSGAANQARSAYYTYPSDPTGHAGKQYIASFTTTFTYTMSSTGSPADGATFIIQNSSVTALGGGGGSLGYQGVTPSFALAINVYGGHALGTEFLTNGNVDFNYTQTNINTSLQNTPITITIGYAAGVVTVTEQQTISGTLETDTKSLAIDLPTLLGSDYAWVGFTGATGGSNSTQQITSWSFDQGVVPTYPTNLAGTVTGYTAGSTQAVPLGAHLTWTASDAPTGHAVTGYKIMRKLTAGGTYVQVGTSTATSFDDTGLTPGSNYFYEVLATNSNSDSLPSASVAVTTPSLPPTPTNSQVNAVTTTSIAFQWQDNANNEDGYQIFRAVNGGTFSFLTSLPADTNPAPSTMTYTDTGLTPGTRYDYHIQSFNLAGYSDFAGITTFTVTTAPTGLTATAGSGSIALSWAAPTGAATFSVYRGTSAGGEAATPIATGLISPSYTDSALVYGTTYYYKVTATDTGGESAKSNEASAFAAGPTATGLNVSPSPAAVGQTVTLTATVTSAGGTPTAGLVQFYDGTTLLAGIPVNSSGVSFYQTTFSAGTHNLSASYGGTSGFGPSTSSTVSETVAVPTTVSSVVVNNGAVQRSEVRSITVTFSGPVTFSGGNAAAAFQLEHVQDSTNVANLQAAVSTNGSGQTVVNLTFVTAGNASTEIDPVSAQNSGAPSLADGRFQLTINGSAVTDPNGLNLDGAGSNTPGSNYVTPTETGPSGTGIHLYRIFGDATGDGIVDLSDLTAFRNTYNASTGNPVYLSYLDADNSGVVDLTDLTEFRNRYNGSVYT
jgi:hypothetical protein